ncbi:hypothetical protein FRB98_005252 [Tulasnella sp. 332]|nr:hypothetical protein FRB98_005252 [Tulasnella sp. 332]
MSTSSQSLLVPMPSAVPQSFESAPEYAQIATSVKAAINNINEIVGLLDHPIALKGDLIERSYAPGTVAAFKVQCSECEHNLTEASKTSSDWFNSVAKHLEDITNDISRVEDQIKSTDQELAKNTAEIEANVNAITVLTENMNQDKQHLQESQNRYREAQDKYNRAKEEKENVQTARNWLCWMPVVAVALTVVDLTVEDSAVNSTRDQVNAEQGQLERDQNMLNGHADQLRQLQQDGLTLHATLTSLQAKQGELKAQEEKLKVDSDYLRPLKINIDHCIHTVSGALGSASNIDNMMSMKNVGFGIKGLVDALKTGRDFRGALASMNEQGYEDLDKKIRAIETVAKHPRLGV